VDFLYSAASEVAKKVRFDHCPDANAKQPRHAKEKQPPWQQYDKQHKADKEQQQFQQLSVNSLHYKPLH
jgi:hypothetical protein